MPDADPSAPTDPTPASILWRRVWIGCVALICVGLFHPSTRGVALLLWMTLNIHRVLRAFAWTVRHPSTWWRARGTIARWAFWPSLLVAVLLRSSLEPFLGGITGQWLPSGVVSALSAFLFVPLFLTAVVWGILGSALAAHELRREPPRPNAHRLGIRIWWSATLTALLVGTVLSRSEAPSEWAMGCLSGVPLFAGGAFRRARRMSDRGVPARLNSWLVRRLVWRLPSGRRLDLRGTLVALVGFLIAWTLSASTALLPFQASALLSEIQLLNTSNPGRIRFHWDERKARRQGDVAEARPRVELEPARVFGPVVLLEWDVPSVRTATTTGSEASVQAAVIRQLAALGARRIAVPAPALEPEPISIPGARLVPSARPEERTRARSDVPALAAAMREAGNVVLLGAPTVGESPADVRELIRTLESAASETASTRLAPFQIAALPAIPLRRSPDGPAPAALALAGALLGSSNREALFPARRTATVLGREYPVLDSHPGRLLLDFVTGAPGRDFVRIPYASVFSQEALFDPTIGLRGAWVPPAEFFRNKVAVLQSLRPAEVATPWGPMEATELVAHGVRTLLGGFFVRPVPTAWNTAFALGCALVMGRLGIGRNPIKASWRLVLVAVFAFGLSLILLANGLWLDSVFASVAALASFLLVTQLTLSLERSAKERNRFLLNRFVAKEVVDELLDPVETRIDTGGERERVVVLFADVRGFTQFAEAQSPEEVMTVVNAYLQVMTEALHRHGGILDKYTGDGLMALFRLDRGATVAGAVRGALAMRDAVLQLSTDRASGGDPSLRVGISMHVGEAVVGLVGNPERQVNFTALGHTVVVAARLQTQAAGGEVIASAEVHAAAGESFEMVARPEVRVKGVSQPVQPFVIVGETGPRPTASETR